MQFGTFFYSVGVHMNNVEKKVVKDFADWRTQRDRNQAEKEAVKKDM